MSYTLPTWACLRWLTDAGPDVPAEVRARLVTGLFSSAVSLIAGAVANMSMNIVAVILHPTVPFIVLIAADVVLLLARIALLIVSRRIAERGGRTPTDLFILSSVAWAALVGVGTALCFASGDAALRLAPVTMMGILSGIVTRNNGAPRLAITQLVLCDVPLQFVIPFCGDPWMLVSIVQCPLFIIALVSTVFRLNRGYLTVVLAERESEARANTDALTGLLNRSGLMVALSERLRHGGRDTDRLALLFLDLDGFKAVNDGFGHAAGDELLKQAARRISAATCGSAHVARLGGDEFVVLMPGCDAAAAAALGDAMMAAVSRPYDLWPGVRTSIGVSIGIAVAGADADITAEALLAEADAALYEAKGGGKGRCVLAAAKRSGPAGSGRLAA